MWFTKRRILRNVWFVALAVCLGLLATGLWRLYRWMDPPFHVVASQASPGGGYRCEVWEREPVPFRDGAFRYRYEIVSISTGRPLDGKTYEFEQDSAPVGPLAIVWRGDGALHVQALGEGNVVCNVAGGKQEWGNIDR
jgi:hypothetical protein